MEEAKREKEERKVLNAQSGKNVDIDFELMIEKSKFKEKLLSPHTQSDQLKVFHALASLQYVFERGQYSRKRSKMDRSIQYPVRTHR